MHRLVHTIRFESARKLTKVPKDHPCSNLYGLAFKLDIHVKGNVNPETGFVVDFDDLEKGTGIKKKLDHNYLNDIKFNQRKELSFKIPFQLGNGSVDEKQIDDIMNDKEPRPPEDWDNSDDSSDDEEKKRDTKLGGHATQH